jgi:hemolysin activation/secretion protein
MASNSPKVLKRKHGEVDLAGNLSLCRRWEIMARRNRILAIIVVIGTLLGEQGAMAATPVLPGSADAGRVDEDRKKEIPLEAPEAETQAVFLPGAEVPKGAEKVRFTLRAVNIEGATAFPPEEIEGLYREYLGQEIGSDKIWHIADLITRHYQDAGYFLSHAFVPKQTLQGGRITIRVAQGYVGEVELNDPIAEKHVIRKLIKKLTSERPAKIQTVESLLLRLNDLPGLSFRSVYEPLKDERKNEAAVKLILIADRKPGTGSVSFDNFNSRYLGPNEGAVSYSASLIPLQQTSLSFLGGVPLDKLTYWSGSHTIAITPELSLQFYGGYTAAHPGYSLAARDITSDAPNLGFSVKDQFIRQRQENLSASFTLDGKDNYSDVLGAPLTRDRVRAARFNVSYDRDDPLGGYDFVNSTVSQGLRVLDASSPGQQYLSRAGAQPDFSKLEYGLTRFQALSDSWTIVTALSGQVSSGVLYSAEQFGFGGQAFGRAYDPSEFTGDNGIAGSIELRYLGIPAFRNVTFAPYGYYDAGKVWNNDATPSASGTSAGLGIRLESALGLSGNLLVAEPLTTRLEDPESGNGKSPRYLCQISYKF